MSGRLRVSLAGAPLDRLPVDVAVVPVPADERPLQGCAGRADWRLCGRLSELIVQGRLLGEVGEAALLPSTGGLRAPLVLALGIGRRADLDPARCREVARDAVSRALDLRAAALALPLLGPAAAPLALEIRLGELLAGAFEGWAPHRPDLALELVPAIEEAPAVADLLRIETRIPGGVQIALPSGPWRASERSPRGASPAAPFESPSVK